MNLRLAPTVLLLRTFAVIVYGHPYCARNFCRNGFKSCIERALLERFVVKYVAGGRCHYLSADPKPRSNGA